MDLMTICILGGLGVLLIGGAVALAIVLSLRAKAKKKKSAQKKPCEDAVCAVDMCMPF